MTTGALLLSLALLMLVALFVIRPFLLPPQQPPRLTAYETLVAQKEALLAQIKALDFDLETGKMTAADHTLERQRLLQRAAEVLRQLDAATDVDAAIEVAVRHLRQTTATHSCPQCAATVRPDDNFCPYCGLALREPSTP